MRQSVIKTIVAIKLIYIIKYLNSMFDKLYNKKSMSKDNIKETSTNSKNEKKDKPKKRRSPFFKYKQEIEEKKEEIKELEDKYLRLFAEFENYKKRVRKENANLISTASENVISVLLPVLDDFERAKLMAEDENTEETFSEGISLVYDKLFSVLKAKGLNSQESTGLPFDSEIHEAIAEIPAPEESKKGIIIDTVEKGYKLYDKIIRYPKVVVGK
jgi:molecular chaperone GrpE